MPESRKRTLKNFAIFMANNEGAETLDDDAILAIKGIGQWTLDYINMRGKKAPDVYLAGDLIVRKMAAKYPLNPKRAAPWRSYLTLQLWEMSNQ
jgi:AraC family transcriptional regulator of adaptative response / DNA-3-methyladenine glycosylase II